jgi:dTDP-4-amino-4,6-dideoxygalactose transaminase
MRDQGAVDVRLPVPFLDLRHVHDGLKAEILSDLSDLIDTNAFTNGPQVRQFEEAYAEWCGSRHCVGLASGLDALRLALLAAGIEPGDGVIVPANTFIATFEAVAQAGGRPVPVDVGESDYNLDLGAVEAAITARTRFLLPVHLYGQMTDMRALSALASHRGLTIVEDACQAHGAARDGLVSGTAGLAGAFSFYPGKNLGAMGDAGALVTDDEELAEQVRALREHGQREKYRHELEGYTARLDTIQALVLLHKLPELERWNEERRSVAQAYTSVLEGIGDLVLPSVPEGSEPVWHLYVVRTAAPERLAAFLGERGIGSGRHYPEPAHLSPAYRWLGYERGSFPVTERLAGELLSLPIFPGMSEEQVDAVVRAISEYFGRG